MSKSDDDLRSEIRKMMKVNRYTNSLEGAIFRLVKHWSTTTKIPITEYDTSSTTSSAITGTAPTHKSKDVEE